jgi:hypothetical protein
MLRSILFQAALSITMSCHAGVGISLTHFIGNIASGPEHSWRPPPWPWARLGAPGASPVAGCVGCISFLCVFEQAFFVFKLKKGVLIATAGLSPSQVVRSTPLSASASACPALSCSSTTRLGLVFVFAHAAAAAPSGLPPPKRKAATSRCPRPPAGSPISRYRHSPGIRLREGLLLS